MTRMYSRFGGVEVADLDATTTCRRFPDEWTLEPWTRPDGRPEVSIPPDWDQKITGPALVELARTTVFRDGPVIETAAQAYAAISEYLAGSGTRRRSDPT
jgi:hypothetical protein